MNRSLPANFHLVPLLAIAIFAAGCGKETVTVYTVPREETPAPGLPVPSNTGPTALALQWEVPTSWVESKGSAMRVASYSFTDSAGETVDISVTRFPDSAGGVLANINRWRNQIQLPALGDSDLESETKRIPIAGVSGWFVDFAGMIESGVPTRITGAIVPAGGNSWFFKMMGPDATVASQLDNFQLLLTSIHATEPSAARTSPGSTGDSNMQNTPVATGGDRDDVVFKTPEGWETRPSNSIRVASFAIPGSGTQATEVSVTAFPGTVGGDLANVNRWRGQLQLPPIDEDTMRGMTETFQGDDLTFRVFDLGDETATGDGEIRPRILAAIVEHGETTWFIKMTGEAEQVSEQRGNFERFLKSFGFKHPN
jgi:hypothetical protein